MEQMILQLQQFVQDIKKISPHSLIIHEKGNVLAIIEMSLVTKKKEHLEIALQRADRFVIHSSQTYWNSRAS